MCAHPKNRIPIVFMDGVFGVPGNSQVAAVNAQPARSLSKPGDIQRAHCKAEKTLPKLRREQRELFVVVLLNARHEVIGVETISVGSLNASIVHPRLCGAAHTRGMCSSRP